MSKSVLFTAAVVVASLLGGVAHAAPNLVQNSNFEADYVSGGSLSQTYSPPTDWTASGDAGSDNSNPNPAYYPTDHMDGFLGDGGSLSQTIATSIGNSYTVSFYIAVDFGVWIFYDTSDVLTAAFGSGSDSFNGQDPRIPTVAPYLYYQDSFTITATALSTVLSFSVVEPNQDGNFYIADTSVTCTDCSTVTTPVPEPSALWLFLPALFGMGAYEIARARRSAL